MKEHEQKLRLGGAIMSQIVKEITVDVAKKRLFQAIVAKQNDYNSRFLKVTICNEDKKVNVPSTASVILNAERDDESSAGFMGTVNPDGTVTVPLTGWILGAAGMVRCSISIIDADEQKLTTTSFSVNVESVEYTGEEIIDDENYDILIRLISECANAKADCETASKEAENAASKADEAAKSANNAAEGVCNAITEALKKAKESGVFDGQQGPQGAPGLCWVGEVTNIKDTEVLGYNCCGYFRKSLSINGFPNNGDNGYVIRLGGEEASITIVFVIDGMFSDAGDGSISKIYFTNTADLKKQQWSQLPTGENSLTYKGVLGDGTKLSTAEVNSIYILSINNTYPDAPEISVPALLFTFPSVGNAVLQIVIPVAGCNVYKRTGAGNYFNAWETADITYISNKLNNLDDNDPSTVEESKRSVLQKWLVDNVGSGSGSSEDIENIKIKLENLDDTIPTEAKNKTVLQKWLIQIWNQVFFQPENINNWKNVETNFNNLDDYTYDYDGCNKYGSVHSITYNGKKYSDGAFIAFGGYALSIQIVIFKADGGYKLIYRVFDWDNETGSLWGEWQEFGGGSGVDTSALEEKFNNLNDNNPTTVLKPSVLQEWLSNLVADPMSIEESKRTALQSAVAYLLQNSDMPIDPDEWQYTEEVPFSKLDNCYDNRYGGVYGVKYNEQSYNGNYISIGGRTTHSQFILVNVNDLNKTVLLARTYDLRLSPTWSELTEIGGSSGGVSNPFKATKNISFKDIDYADFGVCIINEEFSIETNIGPIQMNNAIIETLGNKNFKIQKLYSPYNNMMWAMRTYANSDWTEFNAYMSY